MSSSPEHTSPLTVYKASAGSGKTFTLAVEYIKLLVSDPENYRYTLAVTFTNKATQEMKQRILSKLYGIANSLPDSDDYFKQVQAAFPQLNERVIRNRADEALSLLVRNYTYFRVETIDSFFQRVLRNLARELGLTANLQVMLNDAEVEDQAVDNIIENVESGNDPLLSWIMDFVRERIDDDKSWNVISMIKDFGKNIFTDFYKDHQEELKAIMNDAEFFKRYTSALRALKASAVSTMKAFADRYNDIASRYNIEDADYTHGHSNAPGYFEKLGNGDFYGDKIPNSYVSKAIDDPTKFVKKSDLGKPSADNIIENVTPLLVEAEKARQEAAITVNSVDLTLQNVNQLRLLGRIEDEVNRINNDNNDYLLSNTQKMLNDLIDNEDSPFIYEKIGGQLRFIMIDEFQDTSTIQWDNFKVLLDDCISHQAGSLIVGDVKQSIYRWRGGDWRLLQSLNADNYPEMLQVKQLGTNYRSQRNIVNFNNEFFKRAAKVAAEECDNASIAEAYSDVYQKVPDSKPDSGLVKVTLLPKEDYDSKMIEEVQKTIEYLIEHDTPLNKIAVIVRKNKHIQLLADYFLHNPVNINGEQRMVSMVSDEAFRLDASLAVNVIIEAMRYITHSDDPLIKTFLEVYCKKYAHKDFDSVFPPNWDAALPLVALAEKLYHMFNLQCLGDQGAYICAFFDQLTAYTKKHIVDINDFLKEWDDNLCAKSIHSDEVNGIRLLTVHKSKGLEFDNVIIPFCDWDIEDMRDILWVQPKQKPYSELPVIPINLQPKRMQNSIYADEYQVEHIKNVVDNLNILYVAFTRASRNLFVIGKSTGAKWPSKMIRQALGTPTQDTNEGVETFTYGTFCPSNISNAVSTKTTTGTAPSWYVSPLPEGVGLEVGSQASSNPFSIPEQGIPVKIESTESNAVFLQSNASKDFMTPEDELEEKQRIKSYIDTGNILHKLFSTIKDYTDIDSAIDQLEFDGVLYEKPMTRQELKDYIEKLLSNDKARDWFSSRWQVFNECSILYYDKGSGRVSEQRPDRVIYDGKEMIVIDFKTGREKDEHKAQVRSYMQLLKSMGYTNISGYLWYIRHNNIVKID